jgi:hypothetical protein
VAVLRFLGSTNDRQTHKNARQAKARHFIKFIDKNFQVISQQNEELPVTQDSLATLEPAESDIVEILFSLSPSHFLSLSFNIFHSLSAYTF